MSRDSRRTPVLQATHAATGGRARTPVVDVVIPVHNEQRLLAQSVRRLLGRMRREFAFPFRITIADNASTDATLEIALALADEQAEVEVLHLGRKGRGNALRSAWTRSSADVVAYMDVDLSTDLAHLPELLLPLIECRADIAIGSRLAPGARVTRGRKRELISRSYNVMLRVLLGAGFSDAQCGFKAARRELVAPLLGAVEDDGWFFDTELLYLAQRARLSIREIPVRWVDDPDSRVRLVSTALADMRGVIRLRRAEHARARTRRFPARGRRPAELLAAGDRPAATSPRPAAF